MALTFNLPSQIVVQTAAQWAVDATVYSNKRILVISDAYYGSTDQRKFKIADGTQTWAQLDYMPISQTLAQVLANGSSTNAVSFKSPDSLTELLVANNNIDAYVDDTSNVSEINITPNTIVISTTGASIDLSATSVTKNSSEILTSSNITQVITNGVTDKAPSEDAVYDALAARPISTKHCGSFQAYNPPDSTTVYLGSTQAAPPNSNASNRQFYLKSGILKNVFATFYSNSVAGSNENVTLYLRNITDATSTLIGTITMNVLSSSKVFTGLSIATDSTKLYSIEIVTPAWVTNPTSCQFSLELEIY